MNFIQETDHRCEETDASVNRSVIQKARSALSSVSEYGWTIDSVAHLLLFVPFAVATILTLTAVDRGLFSA